MPATGTVPQAVKALRHLIPTPSSGPSAWTNGPYQYDDAGNITAIGSEQFVYDKVGRLRTATVRGPDLSSMQTQTFDYDVYGNLIGTSKLGQIVPLPADELNNRLQGISYDASGNVTSFGTQQYAYDALGMLNVVRAGSNQPPRIIYAYTADDERLFAFDVSTGITHWTLRGLDDKVLRDFKQQGSNWSVERDYVYRDGLVLAALKLGGAVEHYSLDHLGTPRFIPDGSGTRIGYHVYWPFGEEWSPGNAQEAAPLKFTGHERDTDASGGSTPFDYLHARYYAPGWGRFSSVDPVLDPEKIKYEPQQWNRYSYVTNNPPKYTDPDGRDKFMGWLLGSAFNDVSTGQALKGVFTGEDFGSSMSQATADWAEDHRAMTRGLSPVPTSKTEVAMIPVLMGLGSVGKVAFNGVIRSVIKNDNLLVKAAQVAGKSSQGSLDNLVGQLAKGNLNPGIGTKNLSET